MERQLVPATANRAPLTQRNPGMNPVVRDARRQAAFEVLRAYYRAVELGQAPLD